MIFHITSSAAWKAAGASGAYHIDSLDDEGFIHCSTMSQVLGPANELFRGQEGLVLLCIDPAKVEAEIVYERCFESVRAYPHIYGTLNTDAVLRVVDFPPSEDGTFSLPPDLPSPHASGIRQNAYPILEYDPAPEAIIEPGRVLSPIGVAEHCVLTFFQDVIGELKEAGRLRQVHSLGSEIGRNPVYEMEVDGRSLTLTHAGVGAPLSAFFLEELIALGCRKFIACGSCGVLDGTIDLGNVVVPETAVRDEGTSYHYLPPSREASASPEAVIAITETLARHHVNYVLGKTWTTDAIYRETAAKMRQRKSEGCLTVEMEAAAFFAVAQFRGVTFGQLLYGGDDLTGDEWDERNYLNITSARQKLFWLAVEACLKL
jgi:uncharacterized protein (DUF952 family)/uridine phosphorylase